MLDGQPGEAREAWARAKALLPKLSMAMYLGFLEHAPQEQAVLDLLREQMPAAGLE